MPPTASGIPDEQEQTDTFPSSVRLRRALPKCKPTKESDLLDPDENWVTDLDQAD